MPTPLYCGRRVEEPRPPGVGSGAEHELGDLPGAGAQAELDSEVVPEAGEHLRYLPRVDPGRLLGCADHGHPGARGDLQQEHQQGRDVLGNLTEVEVLLELVQHQDPDRHGEPRVTGQLRGSGPGRWGPGIRWISGGLLRGGVMLQPVWYRLQHEPKV